MMDDVLYRELDPGWMLRDQGFDPLRESSRQSRYAISNGFMGIRATRTVNRAVQGGTPPSTAVAGLFDTPGAEQPVSALVAAPDWLQLHITVSGKTITPEMLDMSSHTRLLDMGRGALHTGCRLSDDHPAGIELQTMRLVSLADRAIGLQIMQLTIQGGTPDLRVEACFGTMDGGLIAGRREQDVGCWHTKVSGKRLGIAAAVSLCIDGREMPGQPLGPFHWAWAWRGRPGQVVCFQRLVAMARTDTPQAAPDRAAACGLTAARQIGWRGVVAAHDAAWAARWRCSDVTIEGDPAAQQALRFAAYHLNSAANPADERVSVAARALTGDDYRGHVFWDTEIYLLPFYSLTWPEAARAMLMYRFHTLPAARRKAARLGWRGALYAWESADTGDETTPEHAIGPDRQVVAILCGIEEQHIAADISHAVWQYWQATGDQDFMRQAGAEILLETARFWASRAVREADGRRHIRGVIGPDEYHETIDDNAFTNVMARRNIRCAIAVAELLRARWPDDWQRLSASLDLQAGELADWTVAARELATGLDTHTGLFQQFDGYFQLEPIELADYIGRSVPMDVVLGRPRIQASQIIKQADVVALLALLPDEFPGGAAAVNFDYYDPRCSQGSSLSRAMHGVAAARLGRSDQALDYFRQTAAIDLCDTHVSIDGGIHIAALGGLWLIAVFGFAGLSLNDDTLSLDPILPSGWRSMGFTVQWRTRHLHVQIERHSLVVTLTLELGNAMDVVVCGARHRLDVGVPLRVCLQRETGTASLKAAGS